MRAPTVDGVLIAHVLHHLPFSALDKIDSGYKPTEEERQIAAWADWEFHLGDTIRYERPAVAEAAISDWLRRGWSATAPGASIIVSAPPSRDMSGCSATFPGYLTKGPS